jgi:hypothetical protein
VYVCATHHFVIEEWNAGAPLLLSTHLSVSPVGVRMAVSDVLIEKIE